MSLMKRNRKILLVVASLFLLAALPVVSFGQGRGGDAGSFDRAGGSGRLPLPP